jgi:hypothetical protein
MAGKISHIETAKYLRDLGWNEIPTKSEQINVFQLENQAGFFQVDLPSSRLLRDYKKAMYRTVETISRSVGKSVEQVTLELLNPLSDILRLRVQGSNSEEGSLFMEDAINLYDNAKKLLTATAMDIIKPQLFHSGRPPATINEFVNNCRFGQTEIGSYVVSVVCPFARLNSNEIVQLTIFDEEVVCAESITRQVVNKLVSSVSTVKESVEKGNLEAVINDNAETGISANFLEALNGINIYREGNSLDISVKYAPTISSNTLSVTTVSIDHEYYAPIDTVINNIRRVQESDKVYFGRIKQCDALPDSTARKQGRVVLVYLDENNKSKTTPPIILPIGEYHGAVDAHKNGNMVKVAGIISGTARSKKIECSYFEVLS